jgi:hypothetical protein
MLFLIFNTDSKDSKSFKKANIKANFPIHPYLHRRTAIQISEKSRRIQENYHLERRLIF